MKGTQYNDGLKTTNICTVSPHKRNAKQNNITVINKAEHGWNARKWERNDQKQPRQVIQNEVKNQNDTNKAN